MREKFAGELASVWYDHAKESLKQGGHMLHQPRCVAITLNLFVIYLCLIYISEIVMFLNIYIYFFSFSQINGVDVRSVPQDAAVQLVQRSDDKVKLLVEKNAEQLFKNSEFYSLVSVYYVSLFVSFRFYLTLSFFDYAFLFFFFFLHCSEI